MPVHFYSALWRSVAWPTPLCIYVSVSQTHQLHFPSLPFPYRTS